MSAGAGPGAPRQAAASDDAGGGLQGLGHAQRGPPGQRRAHEAPQQRQRAPGGAQLQQRLPAQPWLPHRQRVLPARGVLAGGPGERVR